MRAVFTTVCCEVPFTQDRPATALTEIIETYSSLLVRLVYSGSTMMAMSSVCLLMLVSCGCLYYAEALRGSSNVDRGQVTLLPDGNVTVTVTEALVLPPHYKTEGTSQSQSVYWCP